ncbi:hypothetical protein C8R47DRAFT_1083116 [Mycena vitilis]|nr:hypothetical protein C8R47DRAFT_1083116 [Mycena vitilis]
MRSASWFKVGFRSTGVQCSQGYSGLNQAQVRSTLSLPLALTIDSRYGFRLKGTLILINCRSAYIVISCGCPGLHPSYSFPTPVPPKNERDASSSTCGGNAVWCCQRKHAFGDRTPVRNTVWLSASLPPLLSVFRLGVETGGLKSWMGSTNEDLSGLRGGRHACSSQRWRLKGAVIDEGMCFSPVFFGPSHSVPLVRSPLFPRSVPARFRRGNEEARLDARIEAVGVHIKIFSTLHRPRELEMDPEAAVGDQERHQRRAFDSQNHFDAPHPNFEARYKRLINDAAVHWPVLTSRSLLGFDGDRYLQIYIPAQRVLICLWTRPRRYCTDTCPQLCQLPPSPPSSTHLNNAIIVPLVGRNEADTKDTKDVGTIHDMRYLIQIEKYNRHN